MSPEIHDLQVGPKSFRTFPNFSLIFDPQRYLLTNKSSGRFFYIWFKASQDLFLLQHKLKLIVPKVPVWCPSCVSFPESPGRFQHLSLNPAHCLSSIPWCTAVEALVAWMDWSFGWRCMWFNILCWHCLIAHTFLQTQSPVPPCTPLPSSLS